MRLSYSPFVRFGAMIEAVKGWPQRNIPLRGKIGHATVAILTMTVEEFDGVRSIFGLAEELVSTAYAVRKVNGHHDYPVVVRRAQGQTNVLATQATRDILEDFRPSYLLVIGTAGGHSGRENIHLGDIVVANFIDYSGYWKLKDDIFYMRRNACDHPSLHLISNFAEALSRSPAAWQSRLAATEDTDAPKVVIGAVVAGEMLMGDSENAEQQRIMSFFDKALAFEMESYGVARTVYEFRSSVHYNPQFLIIRGISDLVNEGAAENNAVRANWTPRAVRAAATFALILVERLLQSQSADKTRQWGVDR